VAVTFVELLIELRQKKGIVADHPPHAEQHVTQGRTVSFAMNIRMLGEQLTQQSGAGPR
jgi:hypothetical protein